MQGIKGQIVENDAEKNLDGEYAKGWCQDGYVAIRVEELLVEVDRTHVRGDRVEPNVEFLPLDPLRGMIGGDGTVQAVF